MEENVECISPSKDGLKRKSVRQWKADIMRKRLKMVDRHSKIHISDDLKKALE